MKFIFEYVFEPSKKNVTANKLEGILVAICDESNIERTTPQPKSGPKLFDVYPRYILFDWSIDADPGLHQGFNSDNLHYAMWTVGEHAMHDSFEEAIKALKDMWPVIKRSSDFVVSLDDILKPISEDAKKAVIDIFGRKAHRK